MEQKNKMGLVAFIFAIIAISASAETIYDAITCTNCILDNPTFINFTFQSNLSDNGKVDKSGSLFDGKFYQNHSTISTYYYWIFDKNGTGFYQHNQFGENIIIQFNASEMNNYIPINMNDGNIVNLANPINNQDAATKNYVDTKDNLKLNKSNEFLNNTIIYSDNLKKLNSSENFTWDDTNKTLTIGVYKSSAVQVSQPAYVNMGSEYASSNQTCKIYFFRTVGGSYLCYGVSSNQLNFINSQSAFSWNFYSAGNLKMKLAGNGDLSITNLNITGTHAICTYSNNIIVSSTNATSNYLTC